MINVSNALKIACNSDSLSYKEYITVDGTNVEIKGKMSNTAYKSTTFFGTFNLKKLEFTTENNIDYKKKEVVYYKQVNNESFKIGTYIVTDVKDNDTEEEVTVTCMDYGLKFANTYETNLNYSSGTVTLFQVLQECCTKCGVTLANTSIENGSFIVDGNQFVESALFGDVIAQIALISGNFATINENDELELLFKTITEDVSCDLLLTEDNYEIICENSDNLCIQKPETIKDYTNLDDKRDTRVITCVSLGFSNITGEEVVRKDLDLIAQYGEHWLNIEDNPFAYSTAKQELLIDAIFNKVKGFGYSSFESKYSFKPYLQLGDLIQFKNKAGEYVRSIILKIDTDYDDITLSAPSITNATVSYTQPEDALTTAKKAIVKVDEANAKIELKVSKDDVVSSINLSPENAAINASKISLNGYISNDDGNFIITQDGLAEFKDIKINGGDITLADTGESSDPTIEIYDVSQTVVENLAVGQNLSNKNIQFTWYNTGMALGNQASNTELTRTLIQTDTNHYIFTEKYGDNTYPYYERIYLASSLSDTGITLYERNNGKVTYLTNYTFPSNFGTITTKNSNTIQDYMVYNITKNVTTKFKSTGITIVDNPNNINTYYGSNGLRISDNYGTRELNSNGISWNTSYGSNYTEFTSSEDFIILTTKANTMFIVDTSNANRNNDFLQFDVNGTRQLLVNSSGVTCVSLTQTSKEEYKENIVKLDSGLEIINNTDIYKYNFKDDEQKQEHIGFVIGKNYKYSKDVVNCDKDGNESGADIYSMVSVCFKAIQEQQEQIKELQKQINELKGSENNGK